MAELASSRGDNNTELNNKLVALNDSVSPWNLDIVKLVAKHVFDIKQQDLDEAQLLTAVYTLIEKKHEDAALNIVIIILMRLDVQRSLVDALKRHVKKNEVLIEGYQKMDFILTVSNILCGLHERQYLSLREIARRTFLRTYDPSNITSRTHLFQLLLDQGCFTHTSFYYLFAWLEVIGCSARQAELRGYCRRHNIDEPEWQFLIPSSKKTFPLAGASVSDTHPPSSPRSFPATRSLPGTALRDGGTSVDGSHSRQAAHFPTSIGRNDYSPPPTYSYHNPVSIPSVGTSVHVVSEVTTGRSTGGASKSSVCFNFIGQGHQEEEIKTKIDADSPSFIEKQTESINGIHTKIIISLIYAVFLLLILMPFSQFYSRKFDAPLPGVQVIASTRFLVAGGQSSQLQWEKFGLVMNVPCDTLPRGFLAEIVVRVSLSGPYKYPDPETWKPASAVYWISSSKDFVNPIELRIMHNVRDKANHWLMKVLTAEDNPQNMTYIFKELPNFELQGPDILLSLSHFSGFSVCTTAEINIFRGALLYRKSAKYKYCWDYKLILYKYYPDGIQELLSKGHPGWSDDMEIIDMIFEEDSTHMTLSTKIDMPVQDWHVIEKTSPLRYYKKLLQNNIEGNLHFALLWKGVNPPTEMHNLSFPVAGTVVPNNITVLTNTIDGDSNNLIVSSTEKHLHSTSLGDIMSALRRVNFNMGMWKDLCLRLGLFYNTIDTIEKDEHGANDCLKSCLIKWLNRNDEVDKKGGATWTALISSLKNIGQIPAAEKLNEIIKDYE